MLEAALRAPGAVTRLVAIGPVTDPDERSSAMQGLRLAQDVLGEPPATNRAVLSQHLRCGPRRYLATLPSMLAFDTDAAVAAVRVPTVLLRGSRDPIRRRRWARRLAARLDAGGLVEVPGVGHDLHHSRPRATASAILRAPALHRP